MENFEKFLSKKERAENNLIDRGVATLAKQPEGNPTNLDFNRYTLPVVAHDYPAKTPIMWNSVYKKFNLDIGNVMIVGDTVKSSEILDSLRVDERYLGGGVGVGFKDEVVQYLDEIEPIAKEIGSVNIIVKTEEGKLKGFNTDGVGYTESLKTVLNRKGEFISNKKILILGAGGTANSIVFSLVKSGASVVILNRTVDKAKKLSDRINSFFKNDNFNKARFGSEDEIPFEVIDADVILNVSTKGSSGPFEDYSALSQIQLPLGEDSKKNNFEESEEIYKKINKNAIISDIVLGVSKTPLLKRAEELGFQTLDGIPMVVNQGVEAFLLIHGKELEAKGVTREMVAETMSKAAGL